VDEQYQEVDRQTGSDHQPEPPDWLGSFRVHVTGFWWLPPHDRNPYAG
jgi:hypothetical protein